MRNRAVHRKWVGLVRPTIQNATRHTCALAINTLSVVRVRIEEWCKYWQSRA